MPKKSEVEEVNDLMKQMLEETKLDEDDPTSVAGVTDEEIAERLAKLKDIDPSKFIILKDLKNRHIFFYSLHSYRP